MTSITDAFAAHHKHCDEAYAQAEALVAKKKWEDADKAFTAFARSMDGHLLTEEQHLFPAFEERTGMVGGPTAVMRMEHQQMRGLLDEMRRALDAKDVATFGSAGETLLVLMQQHNMKEENILYPMCDRALGGDGALLDRLLGGLQGAR